MSRLVVASRIRLLSSVLLVCTGTVRAQNSDSKPVAKPNGISFGGEKVSRWRVGVIVKADRGPCKNLIATIPVPISWPEQDVEIVEQDVTPTSLVGYRDLDGVRQLLVKIPALGSGQTARALFTYEIKRREILGPEDTAILQIPKKVPREIRIFLRSSPYIDPRHTKIKSLAKEAIQDRELAWEQVEAIYDTVREKVEYKEGAIKTAIAALKDGYGDCEELTSLFIAMCRASKIPARMVWVPDHCYPEFYLVDEDGEGHWFPCQAAGTRAFGSMPELRPILQKGDNFKVPEDSKPQRYVAEHLSGLPVRGAGEPQVTFVREFVQPSG